MSVRFRNVDASPTDDVRTWPFEAIVITLERGLVGDWRPLLREVAAHPWGDVARQIEDYTGYAPSSGVTRLFDLAIRRARESADRADRDEAARRVRAAIEQSGVSQATLASAAGTSASRLSTYATGKVTPSAAILIRIERVARDDLGGTGT
ncbi:MAG: XRE family transcriptional regulator [Thermoleophilia bacterium]|nr:XRE family transcriptional regulator [Thermoleophilia bacterium]